MLFLDCSIWATCCGFAWISFSIAATRFEIICCMLWRPALPCAHAPAPTRMAKAPSAIRILFIIVILLSDGVRGARYGRVTAVFLCFTPGSEIFGRLQRLLDPRPGIAHLEV